MVPRNHQFCSKCNLVTVDQLTKYRTVGQEAGGSGTARYLSLKLNEEMNRKVKNNDNNSGKSLVFGRRPKSFNCASDTGPGPKSFRWIKTPGTNNDL